MAKVIPALSEDQIKEACCDKRLKLFDGGGLFLLVEPRGSKLWRYKYRFEGKAKTISFGAYPEVSLDDARLQRQEARLLLDAGVDPSAARKEAQAKLKDAGLTTEGPLSVRTLSGGGFEIWKGRAVVKLNEEEAQFVKTFLDKVL